MWAHRDARTWGLGWELRIPEAEVVRLDWSSGLSIHFSYRFPSLACRARIESRKINFGRKREEKKESFLMEAMTEHKIDISSKKRSSTRILMSLLFSFMYLTFRETWLCNKDALWKCQCEVKTGSIGLLNLTVHCALSVSQSQAQTQGEAS